MMRILFIIALVFVSLYIGLQLRHDPGYVFISLNQWTIEMSFWVALGLGLLFFLLLHALLILLHKIALIPSHYSQWRLKHKAQKAQQTTRQGLIEYSEGYWAKAKQNLIKALPNSDTPLLNYLTAAKAAQKMGDSALRDEYLRKAQLSMPDATIAVKLTQAELQLANQQWEQALATLRHLHDLTPHHPYVIKLLSNLYQEVRDWPQYIALLPELKKYKLIDKINFEKQQRHAYLQSMKDCIRINDEKALTHLVDTLPKDLKQDPELMYCYANFLLQNQQLAQAESVLKKALVHEYNEKLIDLYGQFFIGEKQQSFAESLLKKEANSAALYLCLGRITMANSLWGKAKSYFEKSLALKESPEVYKSLGKLFEQLGEPEKALEVYRQGLELPSTSS